MPSFPVQSSPEMSTSKIVYNFFFKSTSQKIMPFKIQKMPTPQTLKNHMLNFPPLIIVKSSNIFGQKSNLCLLNKMIKKKPFSNIPRDMPVFNVLLCTPTPFSPQLWTKTTKVWSKNFWSEKNLFLIHFLLNEKKYKEGRWIVPCKNT